MDVLYFGEVKQVYLNKDIADENKKIDISKINPLTITIDSLYRSVGENVGTAYNIGKKYTVEK
jgi:flavin reductase (DIM6/NTAB) family NADH-FMN oxidoreductase RutF